jgi:hypothetical protein
MKKNISYLTLGLLLLGGLCSIVLVLAYGF